MFLLFPATSDKALEFYHNQSPLLQKQIIACSSEMSDKFKDNFYHYELLKNIYELDFENNLNELVKQHSVTAIITSNDFVAAKLEEINYKIPVINIAADVFAAVSNYKSLAALASSSYHALHQKLSKPPRITPRQLVELFHICNRIPGQTSLNKIVSLIEIFETLPKGDVLELGVLFGKSATALGYLNNIYLTGKLYLVDTWSISTAKQQDSPSFLQQQATSLDWEAIFERFKIEIATSGISNYEYLRGDVEGISCIADFSGRKEFLSIAHIDGNHDYSYVSRDLNFVLPWMKPGGVIICDDYNWIHGEGVKRAVSEIANQYQTKITAIDIVANSALIRLI
jgi:hypothetical protein